MTQPAIRISPLKNIVIRYRLERFFSFLAAVFSFVGAILLLTGTHEVAAGLFAGIVWMAALLTGRDDIENLRVLLDENNRLPANTMWVAFAIVMVLTVLYLVSYFFSQKNLKMIIVSGISTISVASYHIGSPGAFGNPLAILSFVLLVLLALITYFGFLDGARLSILAEAMEDDEIWTNEKLYEECVADYPDDEDFDDEDDEDFDDEDEEDDEEHDDEDEDEDVEDDDADEDGERH